MDTEFLFRVVKNVPKLDNTDGAQLNEHSKNH